MTNHSIQSFSDSKKRKKNSYVNLRICLRSKIPMMIKLGNWFVHTHKEKPNEFLRCTVTPLSHGKLIIEWVASKFHDLEQSKANWVQIGPKFERFGNIMTRLILVKFGYSEKAKKFEKNLPLKIWHYSVTSNFKWKIFVSFS